MHEEKLSRAEQAYHCQALFLGHCTANHSDEICRCAQLNLARHFRDECIADGMFRSQRHLSFREDFSVFFQDVPIVIFAGFFPTAELIPELLPNLIGIEGGHRYSADGSTSIRKRSRSEIKAGDREPSLCTRNSNSSTNAPTKPATARERSLS